MLTLPPRRPFGGSFPVSGCVSGRGPVRPVPKVPAEILLASGAGCGVGRVLLELGSSWDWAPLPPRAWPAALSTWFRWTAGGDRLSVPKIAIAIAAFSNRKFKIATLSAGSAEKSQKNRGMKSQIAASRDRKFQIAMFLCLRNSKDKSKVPKLSEIRNRCDFLGARFQIAAFPRFRNRSVFGTLPNLKVGVAGGGGGGGT